MRFAWKSALIRWMPSVPEEDILVVTSGKDDLEGGQVIIISYDLLSKKQDELAKLCPRVAILDECHLIKTAKTARSKAAKAICKNTMSICLPSGTTSLPQAIELLSQISSVDLKLFSHAKEFGMKSRLDGISRRFSK